MRLDVALVVLFLLVLGNGCSYGTFGSFDDLKFIRSVGPCHANGRRENDCGTATPSFICRDGVSSCDSNAQTACSSHGGVCSPYDASKTRTVGTCFDSGVQIPACGTGGVSTFLCNDGTESCALTEQGACSSHGNVCTKL